LNKLGAVVCAADAQSASSLFENEKLHEAALRKLRQLCLLSHNKTDKEYF